MLRHVLWMAQRAIYHTHDGSARIPFIPDIDLSHIADVKIHYNESVPEVQFEPGQADARHLWLENGLLYARGFAGERRSPAYVVLEYNDLNENGSKQFLGTEGFRLSPT